MNTTPEQNPQPSTAAAPDAVLVPRIPTWKMIEAALNVEGVSPTTTDIYRAILDAAPQPAPSAEPVAWMADDGRVVNAKTRSAMPSQVRANHNIPLYTAPQPPDAAAIRREAFEEAARICDGDLSATAWQIAKSIRERAAK